MNRNQFNSMWSELYKIIAIDGKLPVSKTLSDALAAKVKAYLYPAGKARIVAPDNMLVDENVGTVTVFVERYSGSSGAVSIKYTTKDGTAKAGTDYVASSGILMWGDGEEGSKAITISITDDLIFENNEVKNFTFVISGPTGGLQLGTPTTTTISIRDNEVDTPPPTDRRLLGGYRISEPFARGTFAIDWTNRKLYMVGHAQENYVNEYLLPDEFGTGTDVNAWPILVKTRTIPGWWEDGYANGLVVWRGKLWAIVRKFYDTSPPSFLTLFAEDGERITINLPRQKFNGFIKFGPGLDPLIGAGGYESGQGSCSGPTLATLDGQVLINHQWPASPGVNLENWNKRASRDNNYWPVNHVDGWVAWEPRDTNGDGVTEGRWASDRVYGGGLVLPEGICYWCRMGTDDLSYARQSETFGDPNKNKTYKYIYDKNTYELIRWELTDLLCIKGQEVDAQGRIYLCEENAWHGTSPYKVDPAIKVFG